MKFVCHCGLRDNTYPTYLVYILNLYDPVDLKCVPDPQACRESRPPEVWGAPFPGRSGYLLSLFVSSKSESGFFSS